MITEQILTRDGNYSLEYYAWRHLPFTTFQQLSALFALVDTLLRIPSEVTEPHVARMKLAFFQSDIAHAKNGEAKHPQIQALNTSLDLSPFNDLCTALETNIDRVQSIDDKDFNRYCKRKRGSVLLMCAEILKKAPLTDHEKASINSLGIFIERIHLLTKRDTCPESIHLFPLKDFSQTEYIAQTRIFGQDKTAFAPTRLLAALYEAQLNHIEQLKPFTPIKRLALSIYYRIKGY